MGRLLRALLIVCCFTGLTATLATAQESESATDSQTISTPRPIEEITVVGQRSLFRLRLRIVQKEDEIFNFFNANNSSDKMDILCGSRAPTGTHIRRRECEPRFMKDRRAENARGFLRGGGVFYNQRELVAEAAGEFEELQSEMFALMAAEEEFARDLADLADLAENYESHRKAMFSDDQ